MKLLISLLMKPHKAISSTVLFVWSFFYCHIVMAQDSNITLGDVGDNITESGKGIANAINTLALVGGAGFVVVALYLLASERQRSQKGMGGPIIMLVIGVLLLTWQFFAQTTNNTILGDTATEQFLNE